jgi:hypothetical protein
MFGFLTLNIPELPVYDEIVQRLRGGEKLLDLGCCFAQELRRLVCDGAPSENLYGADLHDGFFTVGYRLFNDKTKLKSRLMAADIFDPNSKLRQLDGQMDIIHAGSFYHLFSWDQQVQAVKRTVEHLKQCPGSMVVGRHAGDTEPGEKARPGKLGSRYRHNAETWAELWRQVGRETGTTWQVKVDELADESYFRDSAVTYSDWKPETTRRLQFVMRLETFVSRG